MTKGRLEAFSDGVIAILITVMVLEFKAPHEVELSALGGLVATVELTHFGEAPAGALDYERCRGQFHAFLRACGEAA